MTEVIDILSDSLTEEAFSKFILLLFCKKVEILSCVSDAAMQEMGRVASVISNRGIFKYISI